MAEINFELVQTNTAFFFRSEQITSHPPSSVWSLIVASNKLHLSAYLDSINHGNICRLVTEVNLSYFMAGILWLHSRNMWHVWSECLMILCEINRLLFPSLTYQSEGSSEFLRCSVFSLETDATKHWHVSMFQTRGRKIILDGGKQRYRLQGSNVMMVRWLWCFCRLIQPSLKAFHIFLVRASYNILSKVQASLNQTVF